MSNLAFRSTRRLARGMLALLLPQACFACGEAAGSTGLCPACIAELPWMGPECCPRCALPSPQAQVCGRCLRRLPHFDHTYALLRYAFPVREAIAAYKYGQRMEAGRLLCRLRVAAAPDVGAPDLVLPMPLHPTRLAERGFNQAMELARGLPGRLEPGLVQRDRPTIAQAGLDLAGRRRNLRGAFRCTREVSGLHILVVDDVMTSGATLDELARVLKQRGAARVSNLVIARTLAAEG